MVDQRLGEGGERTRESWREREGERARAGGGGRERVLQIYPGNTSDKGVTFIAGIKVACGLRSCLHMTEFRCCIAMEPSSGSNVIPRRARPGLAGLRPHPMEQLHGL